VTVAFRIRTVLQQLQSVLQAQLRLLRGTPLRDWPTLVFPIPAAALLIGAAFLSSAAFGVVRQLLFNRQFGIGEDAAALITALRLAETLSTLVAGGALANALIPSLLRLGPQGAAAVNRFVGRILLLMLAILIPLLAATVIFAPQAVALIGAGLGPTTRETAAVLARILALEVLLIAVEGLLSAVLLARRWFLLPALGIVLRNSVIISTLLLPAPSITTVAYASLGDSLVQLLVLLPGLRATGFRLLPAWQPRDAQVRTSMRLFLPASLSALVNYSGTTVDTAIAALGGAAAGLGAVSNASLLIGLPVRLIGTAPAQAALPRLTALAAGGDGSELARTLRGLVTAALVVAAPLALAFTVIGGPLIRLIFERGAFDSAAAALTAAALTAYAPALPAAAVTELLTRGLLAMQDARSALIANIVQQAVRITLAVVLLPHAGALAVPLAFSVSTWLECLLLTLLISRRFRTTYSGSR
jgi:putative peptidoglycan lipid II flippase